MDNTNSIDTIEFKMPAKPDYVGMMRLAISGIASRMEFTIEKIEDLKIAISEACTNAVQYAYDNTKDKIVFISCNVHSDKLEITVKDTGKGFSIDEPKQASSNSLTDSPSLGLGITFIKNLMDEAEFKSEPGEGTEVRMVKYR